MSKCRVLQQSVCLLGTFSGSYGLDTAPALQLAARLWELGRAVPELKSVVLQDGLRAGHHTYKVCIVLLPVLAHLLGPHATLLEALMLFS